MFAKYNLKTSSDAWHMDSDATEHMSNHREWFLSYKKFDTVKNIKIDNGKYIQAIGSGDIDILAFNGKNGCEIMSVIFFMYQNWVSIFFSVGAALDKRLW